MTGIFRLPRGGRQNKVTKPPISPSRRVVNGSISDSAPASAIRQLAIERAIDGQHQQYKVAELTAGSVAADVADQATLQSTRALVQDGAYFSAPGQAQGGGDADGAVVRNQPAGGSKTDADGSDMLDLHNGGSGDADESGDVRAGAESLVTDMDEAEMSEMVSGAVESYTGENGVTVPRLATRTAHTISSSHGLDMNLSAAAAAAAAAAAMASTKHLATAGLCSHQSRITESSSCRPQAPQESTTEHVKDVHDGTIAPHPQSDLAATKESTRGDAPAIHNKPISGSPPNTYDLAYDSGYSRISVDSALSRRLAVVPGMRLAHQRRPDQQLNLGRRSNVEALFAHIAGEEVAVPCKNCHKGHGPWTTCVIVDGQMCGSCANCWYNASGSRCSFHEAKTPLQFYPWRQSLDGNASAPPPTGARSVNSRGRASPLTAGGPVARHDARHFPAQQQQHPHQHMSQNRSHALSSPHGLSRPSLAAATQPSSAAQQTAAAAAAAAAVAVQKLSYGSHLASLGPSAANGMDNGVTANERLSNGNAGASSPFHVNLITSLLGASRSSSCGGGSGGGGDPSSDAVSAELAPLVTLMINQALAEVRDADQRGRDLMLVEIAAKQLALAIVRLGEGGGAVGEASSVPEYASASSADDTFPSLHEDGPVSAD
ncbi:hypothetical protein SEPCBS57363_006648 [Sporothrix epigloea]|uniref:Uncharacterized protein n=1 Tax=Sporothrix epigloea TaxID=1892477 RepID=A0ABP0E474_9PEZI